MKPWLCLALALLLGVEVTYAAGRVPTPAVQPSSAVLLLEREPQGQDYRLVEVVPGWARRDRSDYLHCVATSLGVSPDGKAAVVTGGSPDALLVVTLGSGRVTRIPAPSETYFSGPPRWSPVGEVIACVTQQTHGNPPSGPGSAEVVIWEARAQRLRSLTGPLSRAGELAWSPDGREIAFIGPDGLEVVGVTGGPPTVLIASPQGVQPPGPAGYPHLPAWSPDGRQIAYLRFLGPYEGRPERLALTVLDRRTRKSREVYRSPRLGQGPAWSPDGRYLMLSGHARAGKGVSGETVVLEAASGKQVSFPGGRHFIGQSWSPDGRAILGMDTAGWTGKVAKLSWATVSFPGGKRIVLQSFSGLETSYMGQEAAWLPRPAGH